MFLGSLIFHSSAASEGLSSPAQSFLPFCHLPTLEAKPSYLAVANSVSIPQHSNECPPASRWFSLLFRALLCQPVCCVKNPGIAISRITSQTCHLQRHCACTVQHLPGQDQPLQLSQTPSPKPSSSLDLLCLIYARLKKDQLKGYTNPGYSFKGFISHASKHWKM